MLGLALYCDTVAVVVYVTVVARTNRCSVLVCFGTCSLSKVRMVFGGLDYERIKLRGNRDKMRTCRSSRLRLIDEEIEEYEASVSGRAPMEEGSDVEELIITADVPLAVVILEIGVSSSSRHNTVVTEDNDEEEMEGGEREGRKAANVLLWRKKMISASVLTGSTAIWILFEWLNYHFLSLIFFSLIIGMVAQFLWSNPSGLMKRSPSQVPRIVLPDELFVSIAITIGAVVNRFLAFLQNVASGGNLKQFLAVFSINSIYDLITLFHLFEQLHALFLLDVECMPKSFEVISC
ncbi:hypothetical protein GIB67_005659 [Kingdonia uniflora]|uniref:Reticulon-like protein n=1 Tax=Kingdonia uniflora TaxID=39325 RepID=A0A7J7NI78_9MAGN|nr:hypothetical protein GIB67_005659 [Kingdonia uniflora]